MSKPLVKITYGQLIKLLHYCPSLAKRITETGRQQIREIQAELKKHGIQEEVHID